MHSVLRTPNAFTKKYLPGLVLFLRLPAASSFVALMSGIVLARLCPVECFRHASPSLVPLAGLLLISSAIRLIPLRLSIFFVCGMLLWSHHLQSIRGTPLAPAALDQPLREFQATGERLSDPLPVRENAEFLFRADSVFLDKKLEPSLRKKVLSCRTYEDLIDLPTHIRIHGYYVAPRPQANFGAFDQKTHFLSRDIWGTIYVDTIESVQNASSPISEQRIRIKQIIRQILGKVNNRKVRGLLQAAILGEHQALPPGVKSAFRTTGVYHLLALSGFHVSVIAGFIYLISLMLPLSRRRRAIVVVTGIWVFIGIIGPTPSLFRAVLMASVLLGATLVERRAFGLNSLGMAGIFWLVVSPISLFTAGFQLSFAATAALLTFYPFATQQMARLVEKTPGGFLLSKFVSAIAVSICALLATAPFLLFHFGEIAPFGILTTLAAGLLMTMSLWTGLSALLIAALFPVLAEVALWIPAQCGAALVWVVELASRITPLLRLSLPFPVLLSYGGWLVGALIIAPRLRKGYGLLAGGLLFTAIPITLQSSGFRSTNELVFFSDRDVDLAALRLKGNKVWLIANDLQSDLPPNPRFSIEGWLRGIPFLKVDGLIVNGASSDPVHLLQALPEYAIPRHLLFVGDSIHHEVESYARMHDLNLLRLGPNDLLLPSPACTLSIENSSSALCVRTPSFQAILGKSIAPPSLAASARAISVVQQQTSHLIVSAQDLAPRSDDSPPIYSTASFGSVSIVGGAGNVRVSQILLSSAL